MFRSPQSPHMKLPSCHSTPLSLSFFLSLPLSHSRAAYACCWTLKNQSVLPQKKKELWRLRFRRLPSKRLPLQLRLLSSCCPHASVKFAVNHKRHKNKTRGEAGKSAEEEEERWGGGTKSRNETKIPQRGASAITDAWNTTWLPPHLVSFKPGQQQQQRVHCKIATTTWAEWEHFVCAVKRVKQNTARGNKRRQKATKGN